MDQIGPSCRQVFIHGYSNALKGCPCYCPQTKELSLQMFPFIHLNLLQKNKYSPSRESSTSSLGKFDFLTSSASVMPPLDRAFSSCHLVMGNSLYPVTNLHFLHCFQLFISFIPILLPQQILHLYLLQQHLKPYQMKELHRSQSSLTREEQH